MTEFFHEALDAFLARASVEEGSPRSLAELQQHAFIRALRTSAVPDTPEVPLVPGRLAIYTAGRSEELTLVLVLLTQYARHRAENPHPRDEGPSPAPDALKIEIYLGAGCPRLTSEISGAGKIQIIQGCNKFKWCEAAGPAGNKFLIMELRLGKSGEIALRWRGRTQPLRNAFEAADIPLMEDVEGGFVRVKVCDKEAISSQSARQKIIDIVIRRLRRFPTIVLADRIPEAGTGPSGKARAAARDILAMLRAAPHVFVKENASPPSARGRPAANMHLPDTALQIIFQYGLCTVNLPRLARVCHQWRAASLNPTCWAGKCVCIERAADITRDQLNAWIRRWHSVERLYMTNSQMDLLAATLEMPHAIVHLWQTESIRVRGAPPRERNLDVDQVRHGLPMLSLGSWREISIAGDRWLACMTADRAPDEVRLMRENRCDGLSSYWAPITLGWASARTLDELAHACSIEFRGGRGLGRRVTDLIVHAELFPDIGWEVIMENWIESGMASRPRPPPLFQSEDQDGQRVTMCTARLDRERGAMHITSSGFDNSFGARGGAQPIAGDMCFFVAVQKALHMRLNVLGNLNEAFVTLPAPLLASSFRPTTEA